VAHPARTQRSKPKTLASDDPTLGSRAQPGDVDEATELVAGEVAQRGDQIVLEHNLISSMAGRDPAIQLDGRLKAAHGEEKGKRLRIISHS
jgi:hypothetical protein